MIYYNLVKITINALRFVKVIIDMVIRYYGFLDSIIISKGLFFNSKFL